MYVRFSTKVYLIEKLSLESFLLNNNRKKVENKQQACVVSIDSDE